MADMSPYQHKYRRECAPAEAHERGAVGHQARTAHGGQRAPIRGQQLTAHLHVTVSDLNLGLILTKFHHQGFHPHIRLAVTQGHPVGVSTSQMQG